VSSADLYTTATELAILLAGRTPVWEAQADSAVPPSAANSGVYLESAVRALVHVSLREQAHRRTARLTIPVVDLTCVYTVRIDGTAVAYDATAGGAVDLEDIVDGIAAAITADGTVNQIVTATAVDESGAAARDTVLIRGIGEADFGIDFTESDAATLACIADPCGAEMRLWWFMGARPGSTPPQVWAWSGELYQLDRRGRVVRLDVAGMDRLHVQLASRIGHSGDGSMVTFATPTTSIGPALSEIDG